VRLFPDVLSTVTFNNTSDKVLGFPFGDAVTSSELETKPGSEYSLVHEGAITINNDPVISKNMKLIRFAGKGKVACFILQYFKVKKIYSKNKNIINSRNNQ
jgi:hypothetical protein